MPLGRNELYNVSIVQSNADPTVSEDKPSRPEYVEHHVSYRPVLRYRCGVRLSSEKLRRAQNIFIDFPDRSRIMICVAGKRKNPYAVALGRKGGKKGGPARAAKMTPEERSESARKAVKARWAKVKEPAS